MKRILAMLAMIILFFGGAVQYSWAAETPKNCSDFSTWKEAQIYFESKGGSKTNNIDQLDADHDGLACEGNQGFDPKHQNPNDEKKPNQPKQEPSTKNNQTPSTQPCSDLSPYYDITFDSQQLPSGNIKLTAKLKGAKEAEGTWRFTLEDGIRYYPINDQFTNVKGTTFTYEIDIRKLSPNGNRTLDVYFVGVVDGQPCAGGSGNFEIDPSIKPNPGNGEPQNPNPTNPTPPCKLYDYTYQFDFQHKKLSNGNIQITLKLKDAKTAEGTWILTLLDGNDDDFIDQKRFEEVKGTTLTYELDGKKLSPKGNYLLEVYFEGIVNGKCSGAYRLFKVNGNQDGSITPAPVQNPPNTGGTLPKTATSSLTYAWIGLVLIALGVVALRWKRSHS